MTAPAATSSPRVSVAMITYNHEKFLAQAIESVLMQQAPFPFELVIGEDCSTDGTRAIVEHYAHLRPDIVRPLLHTHNQGMHDNFFSVVRASRGEFIACLEGDDYWLDPGKLAQQAAVLDRDARIAFTWHALQLVDGNGQLLNRLPWNKDAEVAETLEQLIETGLPGTAGVMIRRTVIDLEALAEFVRFPQGDYPMWLLALKGDRLAHFDPTCLGAYRRHASGATAKFARPEVQISLAEMWQLISMRTGMTAHPGFRQRIWQAYHDASRSFADQGRWSASMRALAFSARYNAMPLRAGLKEYCKCALRNSVRGLKVRLPSPTKI